MTSIEIWDPDRSGREITQLLVDELLQIVDPLVQAATSPARAQALLAELGWDAAAILGAAASDLGTQLAAIGSQSGSLVDLVTNPPQTLADARQRLQVLGQLGQAISHIAHSIPPEAAQLPVELVEHLVISHLQQTRPVLIAALQALGLVEAVSEPAVVAGNQIVRRPIDRLALRLDRLPDLVRDPVAYLRQRYIPAQLATTADAAAAGPKLFAAVADLLGALGFDSLAGPGLGPAELSDQREAQLKATLTALRNFAVPSGVAQLGFTASLVAADAGGPGLFVSPLAALDLTTELTGWKLEGQASGTGLGGVLIRRQDVRFVNPGADTELGLRVLVEKLATDGVALRIGSRDGSRLEIGRLAFTAQGSFGPGGIEYGFLAEAASAAVVLAAGDGDGFLAHVLPVDGLKAAFDLALGWSSRKGLYFKGSSSLDAELPVHLTLGPLLIPSVFLKMGAGDHGLDLSVGATATVQLGPVKANVERLGLAAKLTFPSGGGNLGPAQADLDFKPPTGAGLAIEAGPLVGGGYLSFDYDKGQYAGALQLEFKGIALKAVGIITTRMPDGSDGFSLLVLISAEFTPIQLGYGFTLSGVGGLIGVNRSAAVEVLRAGIKAKTLDSIMFPKDPVANAPQIISNLNAVFPPTPGRFVVGPMARLGWGTPTLLTLDLGLLLELPAPVRLIVLGRLRMVLPHEEAPVVAINMDVIGIVDFQQGQVSIDATLYDSTIAGFVLTGDMALRASWMDRPGFALSAGGFHPRFQPPPGFPKLERLALTLCTGDNPRLRLESYLALTSNTAQFGARLELYAAAAGFSVNGLLTFDALFQFDPFSLMIEITGSAALNQGARKLMSVDVRMTLTGPTPWHAWGKANFEWLFISAEVSFDVRFGQALPPPPPQPVELEPIVLAALQDPRNWSAQLPPEGESIVTLRQIPVAPNELLVHPLATISFSQRVAPLGVEMTRYGTSRLKGSPRMDLTMLKVGGVDAESDPVNEYFAPAQFFDLSDDEKLDQPSFQRWEAGRRLRRAGVAHDSTTPIEYGMQPQTIIVDDPDQPGRIAHLAAAPPVSEPRLAMRLAAASPASRAATRRTGPQRFAGPALALAVDG